MQFYCERKLTKERLKAYSIVKRCATPGPLVNHHAARIATWFWQSTNRVISVHCFGERQCR